MWAKGKVPKYDEYYWGNAHAHPVLSTYYPLQLLASAYGQRLRLDRAFQVMLFSIGIHFAIAFFGYLSLVGVFGALILTFGAVSLRQQPCIIYTLAWFPWTLHPSPIVSSVALGMMLLAGYYPFAMYLLPVSVSAHLLWYHEAWLLSGFFIGLPQLIPFLRHLPNTIKRFNTPCESPESERKFYVGIVPLLLLPLSTSRIWPLTILSGLLSLGLFKQWLPRVHERWLIILQFCVGWMAVSGLSNLGLSDRAYVGLLLLHAFDLYWHNRELLPPRPFCELWKRPSRAFNTPLTCYLEANLGDYKVSGLPWPLFTGHINGLRTIGYCGSMQTKEMWEWRKSYHHDPFIDGVDERELTNRRVLFAYSRKRLNWPSTPIKHLYRNPSIP